MLLSHGGTKSISFPYDILAPPCLQHQEANFFIYNKWIQYCRETLLFELRKKIDQIGYLPINLSFTPHFYDTNPWTETSSSSEATRKLSSHNKLMCE